MSRELAKVQPDPFLAMIERVAANPQIDATKLRELLEVQVRQMAVQAELDFNTAMAQLRAELPAVARNKRNSQTNTDYADLEAFKKVADPLMAKYGFYDRYENDYPEPGIVGTTCEIVHKNGHSKRNRVQFAFDDKGIKGMTNKTVPHAMASSMTYGQRLSFCEALGFRIGEDDDGQAAGAVLDTERAAEIDTKLRAMGEEERPKFLKYMGTDDVRKIRAIDYQKAITALEARKRAQNGGSHARA